MHCASLAVIFLSGSVALAYEPCNSPAKPKCCTVSKNVLGELVYTGCDPVAFEPASLDEFETTCVEKEAKCCPLSVGGLALVCQDPLDDDEDMGFGLFDV